VELGQISPVNIFEIQLVAGLHEVAQGRAVGRQRLGLLRVLRFVKVVCSRSRNRPLPIAVLRHDRRAIVHSIEFTFLA